MFHSFRKELSNPALSEATKLLMLRSAATTHYWSAAQVNIVEVCFPFGVRELFLYGSLPRCVSSLCLSHSRSVSMR